MSILVTLPNTAKLIDSGCQIGDEVRYTKTGPDALLAQATFTGTLRVTEIVSQSVFKMEGYNQDGTVANVSLNTASKANIGTVSYKIIHALSKDEQVQQIVGVANAYASKRVVLVWPPYGEIDDTSTDDSTGVTTVTTRVVNGSYMAAALASAKSSYAAQQGFTNMGIPGPTRLKYSNDYFTKLQLDTLSAAGVFVFVQDSEGAQIYSRHQRTTDPSVFENAELSIVTAVDKVSLDLIATQKPFVGKYNITDDFLSFLQTTCERYLFDAKNHKEPMCGPLIIDGKVVAIRANLHGQNTDLSDGVIEETIAIETGKPGNWINVKLLVS